MKLSEWKKQNNKSKELYFYFRFKTRYCADVIHKVSNNMNITYYSLNAASR